MACQNEKNDRYRKTLTWYEGERKKIMLIIYPTKNWKEEKKK